MTGAIIHEWIARAGGSERVLEEFASVLPGEPIYVLWADEKSAYPPDRVTESWISRTPLRHSKVAALPLMMPTWRGLSSEKELDWLLVSSHLFAHHARFTGANGDAAKLVYAHTPARYVWAPEFDDRGRSLPARMAATLIKPIDRRRAREAKSVAANSAFTARRVEEAWRRDAVVIYPPVDVREIQRGGPWVERLNDSEASTLAKLPNHFILGASRFVPYKRLDLAMKAGAATGTPVVIAGSGPAEGDLRALAADLPVSVHFVIRPSDALLRALYERAAVFVFAAVEDFGIMPVEAMALGTPVVTAAIGGAVESVIHGRTGSAIRSEEVGELADAVALALRCDPEEAAARALDFDREAFRNNLRQWMQRELPGLLGD